MSTPTYTNAELLALWRSAAAALATGTSYSINGRTLTRANWQEVKDAINYFTNLVLAETGCEGDASGTVLVNFNQPR